MEKITGIIDYKDINYNYRYEGATTLQSNLSHDSQRITIIHTDNGDLSRWNKIPRKFVISNKETYRTARLQYLLRRFENLENISYRRLSKTLSIITPFALQGETVHFSGNIINSRIKGRIK